MFSNTFIPFLEHPNDPLDVSVHHFHDITIKFKTAITDQDRIDQQLYPIINTAMNLSSDYKNVAQEELMACMGSGINIKYFESKENNAKWYPKRMDMANYLTWWNDTRNNADNKITVDELKQIYGPEFNREISFEILPFALMLGCWSEIKDTTTKLEYKCGQGCWIVKFQYNDEGKCPAVNMLWGDPEKYGISVNDFKNLLFQLASVEKQIREEQQTIKNDWLNRWNWPPKDKEKQQIGTTKTGKAKYKTIKKKSEIPTNDYMDETDEKILKLIFRWYGPAQKEGDKINPLGMQSGSAFHNFVNYQDFQAKYIGWSNNPNEIYYEGQTQSLTEIVETIKNAIKTAGGLHTLGPKIFSYKGTEIIDGVKTRNKIKNKKIKEIFPRDCRAPQGNLTGTNIINFLNKMETSGQAIYIEKEDDLYKLFAPIQYDWIDKVTSKIYSLMEVKKLYQATIPSGGGVGDNELEDLLDIVLYDIPDDNTSEFVSVLDNLNKLEYSLRHKNIIPDNPNELLLLDNVKLDIIDVNDRLENVEEEALIHKPFNKIIEICNKDPGNDHLKDVLSWVTQLKKLLMDLIIELKNDLIGHSSIEVWENFVDTEGVDDVVTGSALAHIVDFHMNTFKNIYKEPRIGTRSSVSSETELGKASPPPEEITAEIIKYDFQPFQKLEMYLKDYILYEEENKLVLGFQFWKDVVDEIYDRYYQEMDDKDIEIERLKQQLEECLEKLKSDSGSGSDIDIKSNEGNDGSGRGSDSDDQGSRSSGKMSDRGSSKKGAFSGFAGDLRDSLGSSDNSSGNQRQESLGFSTSKGSDTSKEMLHVKSRRKLDSSEKPPPPSISIGKIDEEEERMRNMINQRISGMNVLNLERVNQSINEITNTSPTPLSRGSVGSITESLKFALNEAGTEEERRDARQSHGDQSPRRQNFRKKSTSGDWDTKGKTLFDGMYVENDNTMDVENDKKVAARTLSEEEEQLEDEYIQEGVVEDMKIESQIKKKMKSWLGEMIIEERPYVTGPRYLNLHDEGSYKLFMKIYDALKLKAVETFGNNILKTPDEVDDPTVGKGIEKGLLIEKIIFWEPGRKKKIYKSHLQQGTVKIPKKLQNKFIKRLREELNINNIVAQGYILDDFRDKYYEEKPRADAKAREKWNDDDFINSWIENARDTNYFVEFYDEYPELKEDDLFLGGKRKKKKKKKNKTKRKRKKKKKKTRTKK